MDHQDLCPGSVGVAGGMRPWGVGGRQFREVGRRGGLGRPDREGGPLMMRRYSLKLAAFLLGIAVLAGLGGAAGAGETVVDAAGRDVAVPGKVDRLAITCYGGTTHEVAVLGCAEKIVAQPGMKRFPQLLRMFPRFAEVVDPGSFDKVNVEELMKAAPDLVLVGVSSKKGNRLIEEAGMPTYTMLIGWAAVDKLKQEFLNLGTILGREAEARRLVDYWNEKLGWVETLVGRVPEKERKVVYYTGKTITKASASDWGWHWIRGSGGICALEETPKGEIGVEQVMRIDPDIIVTQQGNGTADILEDPRIQDLKAVKNKAVHECPIGAFWWDRPSPESPLGFMWLAKLLYPDYTREIDLEKETREFFREFYRYELTDEEYRSFFGREPAL